MSAKNHIPAFFASFLLCVAIVTALPATGAGEDEPPSTPTAPQTGYRGVTPGTGNSLPRVEDLKNKSGIWVTWPGFMMRADGGSRVFLQTTEQLSYSITENPKMIKLHLPGARVFLNNNFNPLVTAHFNTPLNRAYLKTNKKEIQLVLELKIDVSPDVSQTIDQDGYNYLFIDFPQGNY